MSEKRLLEDVESWEFLAKRLATCAKVTQYDTDQRREAATMAHAFADLEESFRVFLDQHLPKLLQKKDMTPDEVTEVLLEICDEFRHIMYHVKDPKFYAYLLEPLEHQASQ